MLLLVLLPRTAIVLCVLFTISYTAISLLSFKSLKIIAYRLSTTDYRLQIIAYRLSPTDLCVICNGNKF